MNLLLPSLIVFAAVFLTGIVYYIKRDQYGAAYYLIVASAVNMLAFCILFLFGVRAIEPSSNVSLQLENVR